MNTEVKANNTLEAAAYKEFADWMETLAHIDNDDEEGKTQAAIELLETIRLIINMVRMYDQLSEVFELNDIATDIKH